MTDPLDLAICATCGTQYSTATPPPTCTICDDPRQYVPPTGQTWTTLRTLQTPTPTPTPDTTKTPHYTNIITPLPHNPQILTLHTTPKLAIGQRAFLLLNPHGNILWDCLTYLDPATISHINALGGISAIIISHPHYYNTHLVWAEAFDCPVYLSAEDREWVMRTEPARQVFWEEREIEVVRGSGIPLPPDDVHNIWKALKHIAFDQAYGAFVGMDTTGNCKKRLLDSAKIFVKAMGYLDHAIHEEEYS
ncbi:hypothetical protein ASPCADRAFT_5669 [Aspergillus carbonarius ITEM 5010]|uniref:Metallo-beta-lactamase domain-containing protein n=1 Tax=Aspergillus carbonarius (strain ITEM 5010) TaxID=602072 RepID=A0A1R3RKY3_ASPC5|nr:hypothetical protein ASPCADRAFT_5599 [Aspergillus carbonarius ITEM 5010]OOF95148.1 hypothetical protein ASPCADRAFT_5669 [Aspergillus carbonarius ITEM 5010]